MADALLPNESQGGDTGKSIRHGVSETVSFGAAIEPVLDSLGIGVVVFDKDCRKLHATASANRLINLSDRIDQCLPAGTESKINWPRVLSEVVNKGQVSRFHSVRYHYADQMIRLDISCCPIRDPDNKITSGAVIIQDVTSQAAHENELLQTERLISLGKIAGKVAHELNNPMDGILRYVNLAVRVLDQGEVEKAKEFLFQSRNGLLRMINILSELLGFSRGTHQAMELLPLDRIVEDSIVLMHTHLTGITVNLVREYQGHAPKMRNDGLLQIFNNLIKNASDAMQGVGQLTITVQAISTDWLISFKDTGPGIPSDLEEMIFEPFFTTKAPGRGSGLGLAICKDLIEKYHGTISVCSPQDGGSVFTVSIPTTSTG